MNHFIVVKPADDGDLVIGLSWRCLLTSDEIRVYGALARSAFASERVQLATLASEADCMSRVRFVTTMYSLEQKGLLTGLPDRE